MKLATVPKTILLSLLSVSCAALTSFLDLPVSSVNAAKEPLVKKVVIDPGHGGKDPGCLGRVTVEKNIALSISLHLGSLIEEHFPDVEVIYTRKTDVFVPLHERAQIANKADADLFISIHCNTIARRNMAQGSETYVMGLHRAEENLDVAKRENSAILMEDDYIERYDGYDPDSPEGHIILSMYQNAHLEQSILFADCIEKQFTNGLARKSRGVKQAGFLVLRTTTMPSVLIEAGFLSHDKDEAYLGNKENHEQIAKAVLQAFAEYKAHMEGTMPEDGIVQAVIQTPKKTGTADPEIPEVIEVSTNKMPVRDVVSVEKESKQPESIGEPVKLKTPAIRFYVQLAASRTKLSAGQSAWGTGVKVETREEDGYYKYLAGPFSEPEEAGVAMNELRAGCCKDAFTVAYRNDERIPVKDAVEVLNR